MTRTVTVWAGLVIATCVSWALGASHGAGDGAAVQLATAAVLAIAFVKARYVGLELMELRAADRTLRVAFEAWVAVVGATVVLTYLLA